jgi:uncharacterized protein YegL
MTNTAGTPDPNQPTRNDPDWGEQLFNAGLEFADNPEPRCPCVLLLDTSKSMDGKPLAALNRGLRTFRDELRKDSLAQRRVEVAILTFGGTVDVVVPFITVDSFEPPQLAARGQTPMGRGILKALDLLEARKQQYKANGIVYYRPWLFMITDGEPKGEDLALTRQAVERIRADEAAKKIAFFAVGVEQANMKLLGKISVRPPVKLQGLKFDELFVWLSRSTERVAHSREGEQVALPPVDWGTI